MKQCEDDNQGKSSNDKLTVINKRKINALKNINYFTQNISIQKIINKLINNITHFCNISINFR